MICCFRCPAVETFHTGPQQGVIRTGLDIFAGFRVLGYTVTEHSLPLGTPLTCIGELSRAPRSVALLAAIGCRMDMRYHQGVSKGCAKVQEASRLYHNFVARGPHISLLCALQGQRGVRQGRSLCGRRQCAGPQVAVSWRRLLHHHAVASRAHILDQRVSCVVLQKSS